jgi:hypothetical protein
MEGYCSTGQSPQRAVEPVEEGEEEEEGKGIVYYINQAHLRSNMSGGGR